MKNMRLLSVFALTCALFAQTKPVPKAKPAPAAAAKTAIDKTALEAYVRHLAVWPAQVKVEISDPKPSKDLPGFLEVNVHASSGAQYTDEKWLVSKDGKKLLRPPVYDIAQNPFKPELDKLKTDFLPSFGTPGAPVVIVVFSDFQCPYCREEAKVLRENLAKEYPTQVRVYFRDFPLTQIHPWAKAAAMAGRCVFRQDALKFWDYHDWIFDKQAEINGDNLKDKVLEWGKSKGLDPVGLGRCMDTKATEGDVDKSIEAAKELNVDRTPYLFVNGRRVPGAPWPNLKQIIDFEIDYQKTAKNAGEQECCSVSLKSPVGK
jgi:protein-disulfide isomerase